MLKYVLSGFLAFIIILIFAAYSEGVIPTFIFEDSKNNQSFSNNVKQQLLPDINNTALESKIVNIKRSKKGGSINPPEAPKYTLLIVNAALVKQDGTFTKELMANTLKKLLLDIQQQYRDIDSIVIYLYQSEKHVLNAIPLGTAEWCPKGHSLSSNNAININDKTTYETTITVDHLPEIYKYHSATKHRLSLEEKQKIYVEMVQADLQAHRDANRLYGDTQWKKRLDELDRLRALYNQEIKNEYKLSDKEFDEINTQAMIEQWPMN